MYAKFEGAPPSSLCEGNISQSTSPNPTIVYVRIAVQNYAIPSFFCISSRV